MSAAIKTFTPKRIIEICTANPNCLVIEAKKGITKDYKGAKFYNLFIVDTDNRKYPIWIVDTHTPENEVAIPVWGINARDANDKIGEESKRLRLTTTVRTSGVLGEAMLLLQAAWTTAAAKFLAEKDEVVTDPIVQLIGMKYGKTTKKVDDNGKSLRFQPVEDPIIGFKLNFGTHSPKHPSAALRGRPMLEIKDFNKVQETKAIDPKTGAVVTIRGYGDWVVTTTSPDGTTTTAAPNASNVHEVITSDTILRGYRINIPSACLSTQGFSAPMSAAVIRIEHVVATFDDEDLLADAVKVVDNISINGSATTTSGGPPPLQVSTSTPKANPLDVTMAANEGAFNNAIDEALANNASNDNGAM